MVRKFQRALAKHPEVQPSYIKITILEEFRIITTLEKQLNETIIV